MSRGDAGKVADAVAVRIGEAARIDLIDRRARHHGAAGLVAVWS
jgi:hypothetical protein